MRNYLNSAASSVLYKAEFLLQSWTAFELKCIERGFIAESLYVTVKMIKTRAIKGGKLEKPRPLRCLPRAISDPGTKHHFGQVEGIKIENGESRLWQ